MGSTKICHLLIILQLIYAISAQESAKRVPQGFVGMRGKKYNEPDYIDFYKRKPQFFVGVKGKKSDDLYNLKGNHIDDFGTYKDISSPEYISEEDYEANTGSLIGQIDYAAGSNNYGLKQLDPRVPVLNDILSNYLSKLYGMENGQEKRAGSMHQFYGVRGKKSDPAKRPYDVTFRGKFIGVRGKKDNYDDMMLMNGGEKRKAHMGFLGMRGKKWLESSTENEALN